MNTASEQMIEYFRRNKLQRTTFKNGDKLPLLEDAILEGYFSASKGLDGSVTLRATSKLHDLIFKQ